MFCNSKTSTCSRKDALLSITLYFYGDQKLTMDAKDISNKNRKVIPTAIISANADLYKKLQNVSEENSELEARIILLYKLGFSFSEIRILLEINEKTIVETLDKAMTESNFINLKY